MLNSDFQDVPCLRVSFYGLPTASTRPRYDMITGPLNLSHAIAILQHPFVIIRLTSDDMGDRVLLRLAI
jgi:hypothetical protein